MYSFQKVLSILTVLAATIPLPVVDHSNALNGLRGIRVASPDYRFSTDGTREVQNDEIRVAAESRLRAAGIRVIDDVEGTPGRPVLFISVEPKNEAGVIIAKFSLVEDANPVRNPRRTFRAETWRGSGGSRAGAREALQKPTDEFINDYLKANPR
jgi:hypothetical protein